MERTKIYFVAKTNYIIKKYYFNMYFFVFSLLSNYPENRKETNRKM